MGVVVAILSMTGVIIWYKKYKARNARKIQQNAALPAGLQRS
jgi:hypothetical protein